MNSERKPDEELSVLLSAMLDGQMTAAEESRLGDLLRDNPDAQEFYLDYCRTHALLRQELGGRCEIASLAEEDVAGAAGSGDEMPSLLGEMGGRQSPGASPASVPLPSILLQPSSDRAPLFSPLGSFVFSYSLAAVIVGDRNADRLGVQGIRSRTSCRGPGGPGDRSSRAGDGLCRPRHRHARLPVVGSQNQHGRLRLRPPRPQIRSGVGTHGDQLRQRRRGHPRRTVHVHRGVEKPAAISASAV